MSKFCENCGAEMNDTDVTCPHCGPQAETTATVDNTSNASSANSNDTKKTAIIAIVAIAAIVLVLYLIISIFGGKYKTPIKNYYKGLNKADAEIYLKAYPDFLEMDKTYDDDKLEERLDNLEDSYGDKVKFSYKFLEKDKMEKEDLENVKDYIKEVYDEKVEITKGYTVKVKVTVKGKDDYDYATENAYVYKIDGDWYTLSVSPEYAKESLKD